MSFKAFSKLGKSSELSSLSIRKFGMIFLFIEDFEIYCILLSTIDLFTKLENSKWNPRFLNNSNYQKI